MVIKTVCVVCVGVCCVEGLALIYELSLVLYCCGVYFVLKDGKLNEAIDILMSLEKQTRAVSRLLCRA